LRRVPSECNTGIKLLQRLAFLHRASLRLCPVFFNGKMILPREGPGDLAAKVDSMLAGSHLLEFFL
jgi:hypothetical protein